MLAKKLSKEKKRMAKVERSDLNMDLLYESYRLKMEWIKQVCSAGQFDEMDLENYYGTDKRAADAFAEMCRPKDEIARNVLSFMKTFKIDSAQKGEELGMITQGIKEGVIGLCPHHLLPVKYQVFVSYIPKKGEDAKVLGLSKLTRLTREICKYPMLQEHFAKNLADCLYSGNDWLAGVNSAGSAVMVLGAHGCIACRGVLANSPTCSVELRGCYKENNLEQKFYKQVEAIRSAEGFTW